jgi:hypothetical protein
VRCQNIAYLSFGQLKIPQEETPQTGPKREPLGALERAKDKIKSLLRIHGHIDVCRDAVKADKGIRGQLISILKAYRDGEIDYAIAVEKELRLSMA